MELPTFSEHGLAPCTKMDPDYFSVEPEYPGARAIENKAKEACQECPYKQECFDWAVYNAEPGVWGGTTLAERRLYQSRLRRMGRARVAQTPIPDSLIYS